VVPGFEICPGRVGVPLGKGGVHRLGGVVVASLAGEALGVGEDDARVVGAAVHRPVDGGGGP